MNKMNDSSKGLPAKTGITNMQNINMPRMFPTHINELSAFSI